MKTLLIDDDPFALKLLGRQLELLGCTELTLCSGGREALALLEAGFEMIGLVFCDLQMPDMDGVEFVRHVAHIGYRGDLVLVSGEGGRILQTVEKLAQAHQIHLLGALSKPVSPERLRQVLASHASRSAGIPHMKRPLYHYDELKHAIAGGALVNHYQPKVDLATGALIGVEALVRWQHPQDGLVYPDQFITTAEEHGLIDDLTRAVLTAALRQARQWQDAGLELQMAVNVSMENLTDLAFPELVVDLVSAAGIVPSNLVLEVTESRLMKDARAVLDILARLRLKRIGLSIDDFGTGNSSLAQLRDIPFDELKLDRSFVHGVTKDASLRAIVEATLAMAGQLGMKVVAEGVENCGDWDYLKSRGCHVAQGYLIARPMPGGELQAWGTAWDVRRHALTVTA